MTLIGQADPARRGHARARAGAHRAAARPRRSLRAACAASASMGGLLIGLSTFQAEFDFGVPQFRLGLPADADRARRRHRARRARASGSAAAARSAPSPSSSSCAARSPDRRRRSSARRRPHFPLYLAEAAAASRLAALVARPATAAGASARVGGPCHRHGRLRRRVRLDARLDAAALERRAPARGRSSPPSLAGVAGGAARRPARARRCACRPAATRGRAGASPRAAWRRHRRRSSSTASRPRPPTGASARVALTDAPAGRRRPRRSTATVHARPGLAGRRRRAG